MDNHQLTKNISNKSKIVNISKTNDNTLDKSNDKSKKELKEKENKNPHACDEAYAYLLLNKLKNNRNYFTY